VSKLALTDTTIDAIMKMSEGNPGAVSVTTQMIHHTEQIDPDNLFGGLGNILRLDDMGIYGSHIWILFKDICGESIYNLTLLLRANQLGYVSESSIKEKIDSARESFTVDEWNDWKEHVCGRLPKFAKGEL